LTGPSEQGTPVVVAPRLDRVIAPTGYLLCGTPRTGSTLLCSLLSSAGVLGRPESYFREPDEGAWARRFGLPVSGERVRDYRAFVRAVRAAATTDNGIFAARVMWGSIERLREGIDKPSHQSDLTALEAAFGRLAFVHLAREDVVAQAVSCARAEQTGYWQHGDTALRSPERDLAQMTDLVGTIREHNASWRAWFVSNGIHPHHVTYEELVAEPRSAVEGIAARLQVAVPVTWQPASPHRRQADRMNEEWAELLRRHQPDLGRSNG